MTYRCPSCPGTPPSFNWEERWQSEAWKAWSWVIGEVEEKKGESAVVAEGVEKEEKEKDSAGFTGMSVG